MAGLCGKCVALIKDALFIICYSCKNPYHAGCTNIQLQNIKFCNAHDNIQYICPSCLQKDCLSENKSARVFAELDKITAKLTCLVGSFDNSCLNPGISKSADVDQLQRTNRNISTDGITDEAAKLAVVTGNSVDTVDFRKNIAKSSDHPSTSNKNKMRSSITGPLSQRPIIIGTGDSVDSLQVVEPRKTLFVSRLHKDVSELEVLSYLKDKFNVEDVSCKRILPRRINDADRNFSSFRINIPVSNVDSLLQPSSWPSGSLIKEFVNYTKKRNSNNNNNFFPVLQQTPTNL